MIAALYGQRRSIPACAGEPLTPLTAPRITWVYPRVCGGTDAVARFRRATQGLSPRVRGNPGAAIQVVDGGGSIPACAGEPAGQIAER